MLVTVKNLQQQTFQIDIDVLETVLSLKQRIEDERGKEYAVDRQKIIYAGMLLVNERTLESYKFDENKFVVVMLSKVPQSLKEAAKPVDEKTNVANAIESPCTEVLSNNVQDTVSTTGAVSTSGAVPSSDTTPNASPSAEELFCSGEEYSRVVENMIGMGFSHDQVRQALEVSFNNPYRAADFLLSELSPNPTVPAPTTQTHPVSSSQPTNEPLAFLRDQPQFQQMRQLVRQNPEFLDDILQQISQTDPALLETISENQQAFLDMINEQDEDEMTNASIAPSHDSPAPSGNASNPLEAIIDDLHITQADRDAMDRLEALGFAKHLVLQSYIACERNENMAANLLLSHCNDE